MAEWWENLGRQEKMAAAATVLAVALLLLYLLLQPLLRNRARLREEVTTRRAELAWMQEAAREIGQSDLSARNSGGTMPPLQFIDQAARENHLSDQLKRMEPGTGNEIKVWLSNAAYVDLVRWLRQLSASGRLTISSLNVEKGTSPGLVSAQLTLNSGSTP
jgi:type II secretory pathway component PulM